MLETLLLQTAAGDRPAFEELYRRTSMKLFAICLRINPRRQEAEEALQDAYVLMWQRAARFEPGRGAPLAWLAAITRNAAIDRLRAHRHRGGRDVANPIGDTVDPTPLAIDTMLEREEAEQLGALLDGLDARDAAFLREAFYADATYGELATRAGLPLGTVKSRIRRALLKLREHLA